MSKLICRCGHPIRTGDEQMPYAASLVPDRLYERMSDMVLSQAQSFAEALRKGQGKSEWAAIDSQHPAVVDALFKYEFFDKIFLENSRDVYQCEQCSRIYIETNQPNHFRSFAPETDDSHGLWV